mmetsp:Transcript_8610/g.25661  ORF Transcript_8610/g.25661 Transcript_8610/m.25661 type:complete len:223 (-) Transcript_8610:416-1084(-)
MGSVVPQDDVQGLRRPVARLPPHVVGQRVLRDRGAARDQRRTAAHVLQPKRRVVGHCPRLRHAPVHHLHARDRRVFLEFRGRALGRDSFRGRAHWLGLGSDAAHAPSAHRVVGDSRRVHRVWQLRARPGAIRRSAPALCRQLLTRRLADQKNSGPQARQLEGARRPPFAAARVGRRVVWLLCVVGVFLELEPPEQDVGAVGFRHTQWPRPPGVLVVAFRAVI